MGEEHAVEAMRGEHALRLAAGTAFGFLRVFQFRAGQRAAFHARLQDAHERDTGFQCADGVTTIASDDGHASGTALGMGSRIRPSPPFDATALS